MCGRYFELVIDECLPEVVVEVMKWPSGFVCIGLVLVLEDGVFCGIIRPKAWPGL